MKNIKYFTLLVSGVIFFLLPTPAWAASLSLIPYQGTFNRSCNFSLDVRLDTAGTEVDGVDAYILYDNSRLTANSPVKAGTIFAEFPGTNVDELSGKVSISGLASVSQPFSGQGKLATIDFTVKENAPTGATQIKFDFDPNDAAKTTDSNVVARGTAEDVLSSVVNGTYTIGTGNCTAVSPSPSPAGSVTPRRGAPSDAISTPSAKDNLIKGGEIKVLPEGGSNKEWTAVLFILGTTLTVLGMLGLALL